MEELPTDARVVEYVERDSTAELEKSESLLSSPMIEVLGIVKDSLIDIRNIMALQNQRLEALDSLSIEAKLKGVEKLLEMSARIAASLGDFASKLDAALDSFVSKASGMERAAGKAESAFSRLDEAANVVSSLAASAEAEKMEIAEAKESMSRLAAASEQGSSAVLAVAESYSASLGYIEKAASLLGTMQENLHDLRNDIFERNQYLNILISDLGVSKESMENSVRLAEAVSARLKETAVEMDRKTDDILNVTARKLEDLKNLRELLYDDIAAVDSRVKKVQKAVERQAKSEKKKAKKGEEMSDMLRKMSRKINSIDRRTRAKPSKRRRQKR